MDRNPRGHPVVVISLFTAVCLLGDSMLYVVLPVHYKEAGLSSLWEVGVLLSVNRFVRLPLNPLASRLYRSMSIRGGILLAVGIAAVTTSSYGLLPHFWGLLLMRCLWGFAWTLLRLGAYFAILEVSSDDNRGHHMGLYNGLYRLGSLFGMLVGGLLADICGIGPVAVGFGLLALFSLPFAWRMVTAARITPEAEPPGYAFGMWRDGEVRWVLVSGLIVAFMYQGLFTGTLSHLIDTYNAGPFVIGGMAIGAATLAGCIQSARWGWEPFLAPLFGRMTDGPRGRRVFFSGTLFIASVLFAAVTVHMPPILWLFVLLGIQLTATSLTTVMDALASDAAVGRAKAAVMTAYAVSTDLGAALGPLLAYPVEMAVGPGGLYLTAGTALLILAVRWLFFRKTEGASAKPGM